MVFQKADERRRKRAGATRRYPAEDLAEFEIHVLYELDGLSSAIKAVRDERCREALSLALSSILTKVSRRQGDSSERRAERRLPSGFVLNMFVRRVAEMAEQFREFSEMVRDETATGRASVGDARRLRSLQTSIAQLILTSPPYPAVYDYFRHHEVRLRWLEEDGSKFEHQEMGSRRELARLTPQVAQERWKRDFRKFMLAARRTLLPSGHLCLVMADSAVRDQALRADEVVGDIAPSAGLELQAVVSQERPLFHRATERAYRDRPRREHVVVLRRT